MFKRIHYFILGLFFIVAILLAFGAVIMFGAGELLKPTIKMETYFNESVQGLDVGSPVKYRGVQVGKVEEITFVDDYYYTEKPFVMVRIALYVSALGSSSRSIEGTDTNTAIKEALKREIKFGLRVRLTSQGLTGVAYLEADYLDPKYYPPLEIDWEPKTFYVPTAPSVINRLSNSAEVVFRELEAIELQKISKNFDTLLTTYKKLADDMTPAVKELEKSLVEVPQAVSEFRKLMYKVNTLLSTQERNIEETLTNMRVLTSNIKDLSSDAKKYPSQILFGKAPPKTQFKAGAEV